MASDNALRFDFVGRDKSVGKTMDHIADKGDGLGRKLGRAGKVMALAFGGAALGGIAAVGAALVEGGKAAARYEVLGKKTAAVIKSTGNLAGISVKGVQALAGSLESMSGVDEELIINSQNVLATFTNIRNVGKNRIFDAATKSALDMSVALGVDLQGATIQIGKALNDPIKGITALSRVGVSFTKAQKDQIKALVDSGKTMEAQKLILAELSKEFGGAAKAAGDTFTGKIERAKDAVGDLARDLGAKALPALGALADWVTEKGIPKLRQFSDWMSTKGVPRIQAGVKAAREKLGELTTKLDLSGLGKRLAAGAKAWAKDIIDGVRVGLETGDWSQLGRTLGEKVAGAITGAADLTQKMWEGFRKWAGSVDWFQIGANIGKQAVPFIVGFASELFDPGAIWNAFKKHKTDFVLGILAFTGLGKIGGRIAKVLEKIPFLRAFAPLFRGLDSVTQPLQKAFDKLFGFMGRHFREGFRKIAPNAGAGIRRLIDDIVLRFMYGREAIGKALDAVFGYIPKKIGEGVGWVVSKTPPLMMKILRAMAKPFIESGKMWGDAFGFVFRTVGGELGRGVVLMAKWGGRLVRGLARGIRSALGVPAHAMGGGVARILATVRNLPGRLFTKGSAAAQRLGAGIRSVARNFGSLLWNAGSSLMSGLASGIQSGYNNYVAPKLKWITDHIPKLKGPEEKDKKLLTPNGRWIMGSLVKGLDPKPLWEHLSGITDGIAGMGKGAGGYKSTTSGGTYAGAMTLPGASSGSAGPGGMTVHLHFHDSVVASRQQASDMVVAGLRMAQQQARLRVKVV